MDAMEDNKLFHKTGMFHINGQCYDLQKLTFAQICVQYWTGRSFIVSGAGRDRKYGYRHGCMTQIGDIELSQWKDIIKYLIERDDEQQLQKDLFSWVKHTCRWLHTQKEQEEYSLSLHASRIFDRKEWIDYVEFNKLYRPEVLMGTMKGVAQNECESKD